TLAIISLIIRWINCAGMPGSLPSICHCTQAVQRTFAGISIDPANDKRDDCQCYGGPSTLLSSGIPQGHRGPTGNNGNVYCQIFLFNHCDEGGAGRRADSWSQRLQQRLSGGTIPS